MASDVPTRLKPHSANLLLKLWGKINPSFRTAWCTLGHTIYHPDGVEPNYPGYAPIREHEMIHVKQYEKFGMIWFFVLYILGGLPIGFCWGRWRLEREAYLEVQIKRYGMLPEAVVEQLGSALYLWPWPKKWQLAWFRSQLVKSGLAPIDATK